MINKILIENSATFSHVELKVGEGFNVISGVSGAGKSVFLNTILSAFGLKSAEAKRVELELDFMLDCGFIDSKFMKNMEHFGILQDKKVNDKANENVEDSLKQNLNPNFADQSLNNKTLKTKNTKGVLKTKSKIVKLSVLKKQSTRYFIDSQAISKKALARFSAQFVKHIGIKDGDELESDSVLRILDALASLLDSNYMQVLKDYKSTFYNYKKYKNEFIAITQKQENIENLKEFARFEIDKLEGVRVQVGEYEKLINDKKNLSKKEKVLQSCSLALSTLDSINNVSKALELLDMDVATFDSVMLDVRASLENAMSDFENLDMEPEALLDRIATLAEIIRRYGSEEAALQKLEEQKEKLRVYENAEFDKKELEKKCVFLESELASLSTKISQHRTHSLPLLESRLNHFTHKLRLGKVSFNLNSVSSCVDSKLGKGFNIEKLTESGADNIGLLLDNKPKNVLSSGEYNRMRLSILCVGVEVDDIKSNLTGDIKEARIVKNENLDSKDSINQALQKQKKHPSAILILDEIDANLSGEESEGVAELLAFLSKKYQVFAISHQPFMPLLCDNHYLITKDFKNNNVVQNNNDNATIKLLNDSEKIKEIARMISGSNLDSNAIQYAETLLDKKRGKEPK